MNREEARSPPGARASLAFARSRSDSPQVSGQVSSMRTFFSLFLALGSAGAVTGAIAACSSSSDTGDDTTPDGSAEAAPPDARAEAAAADAGGVDGGRCSAVTGDCDIVLQDCPKDAKGQPQECVVSGSGTSFRTRCIAVQASQTLPKGRSCCPGADNPCLPGLSCVGDPCVDGGPKSGRCSPACCEGDDQACGLSEDGIAGACDITLLVGGETEVHRVCSYRERCKPFGEEPCKPGNLCLVEDKFGTAGCINSFDKQLGEACRFSNDCADGLMCFSGLADGGSPRCHMVCLTPNSIHPFDASVEEGGPGRGGCPPGAMCTITGFSTRPAWFSLCTLDGGS